jgi:hypothetical protein
MIHQGVDKIVVQGLPPDAALQSLYDPGVQIGLVGQISHAHPRGLAQRAHV